MTDGQRLSLRGWIFFDADCDFCRRSVKLWRRTFERRGFAFFPLQASWVRKRLGLSDAELLREMRVVLANGRLFGGADAILQLARHVWWMWPMVATSRVLGMRSLLRAVYRKIAAARDCAAGVCTNAAEEQRGAV